MCRCTRPSVDDRAAYGATAMGAVPVALPHALQNCAPEPIGDPHLSQNIDRSSICYRYARRARKVSSSWCTYVAAQIPFGIGRMVSSGMAPFNHSKLESKPIEDARPPLSVRLSL